MKFIFIHFFLVHISIYINIAHFVNRIDGDDKELCNVLNFNISTIPCEACVKTEDILHNAIVSRETKVIIENENGNETYLIERLGLHFVTGYIFTKPQSLVSGFIKDDHFFGRIQTESEVFYVENQPCTLQYANKRTINIPLSYKFTSDENVAKKDNRLLMNYKIQYLLKKMKPTGKICTLLIMIDNSFLRIVGKNNIKMSILTILHSLDQANSIFRCTDFDNDGIPDNIGFKVKYIVVIESEKSLYNILPPYSPEPIEGKMYLYFLSRHQLLGEVCLGVAFTGQTFTNRALGLSYTAVKETPNMRKPNVGGICERPSRLDFSENFNTLAISYCIWKSGCVSQKTADLSLAHELGHSFGSNHDYNPSCYGHVMTSHSVSSTNRTSFIFSKCSKKSILNVIRNKGHCLEDTFETYCGNGIVEEDEDCDCGLSIDCVNYDLCCTRKGSTGTPCKVNKEAGYECHPSQGLCCELNCKYKNLSHLKLNCVDTEKKCPCKSDEERCDCGLLGECTGNECHSKECTRLNLRECECPRNAHGEKCGTCCYDIRNKCRSSREITKDMFANNSLFANNFKMNKLEVDNQFGNVVEKFCNKSKCVELPFRYYDVGDFCVFRGALGTCKKNLMCAIESPKKIFPKVQKVEVSGTRSNFLKQNLNVFLLLSVAVLPAIKLSILIVLF